MKQKYELMIIISSTISDEEIKQRVAGLKEKLGEVVFEEVWGMRDFAYPIKKQHKGHYVVWNFMAGPEEVEALKESMKLYPDLLRSLVMKVPEDYTPMALADIEAGLEKLREEKAEKRNSRGGGAKGAKKPEKKTDKPAAKPAKKEELKEEKAEEKAEEVKEEAKEEKAAEASAEEAAPAKEEEKKADKGDKTLDQKLDEILSDADLGL